MSIPRLSPHRTDDLRHQLLEWFAQNRRDLPWRRTSDPYGIWVSEIMLQQTRVAAVVERWVLFLERFPTVAALAEAEEQEVLALWSGLGYYRRARMLHQAARKLAAEANGKMPGSYAELRKLPGIGAYTAAAISSIAYGEVAAVVDGNVERVVCRLRGWEADGTTELKRRIDATAAELIDPAHPGDFNQAMMELGAMVCTPRSPLCMQCPIVAGCATRGEHKTKARPPMQRQTVAYALVSREGKRGEEILLQQRSPQQSVMPGLWELPALQKTVFPKAQLLATLSHAIMQVNYMAKIRAVAPEEAEALTVTDGEQRWVPAHETENMALTGLTRKALKRCGYFAQRKRAALS